MNPSTRILYPWAWFAMTGLIEATPGTGTVSNTFKPAVAGADAAGDDIWYDLGRLAGVTVTPTIGSRKEIWTATPGRKVLGQEIALMPKTEIVATCQDLTKLALQALYMTAPLSIDLTETAFQFNPMEGSPIIEGWLKIQFYDHNNVAVKFIDAWCGLNFEGGFTADGDNNEYQLKATVYHSKYNTGVGLPA